MIDLIGTLRRLTASVLGVAADTTTIAVDVAGLDGDAMRGTDDATLQATWTDAMATALANYTAARAVYLDELAAANIPSDVDDLLANLAAVAHHEHARSRVYPQDTQNTITLVCSNAAPDTWGVWTEIVPINTIAFCYAPVGIMIEETTAGATYCIQLGYSILDGSDPTVAQIMGERRTRLIGTPIKTTHEKLNYWSFDAPANAKLWGRVKSSTGNADEVDISVVIIRHSEITNPIVPLATWPWA